MMHQIFDQVSHLINGFCQHCPFLLQCVFYPWLVVIVNQNSAHSSQRILQSTSLFLEVHFVVCTLGFLVYSCLSSLCVFILSVSPQAHCSDCSENCYTESFLACLQIDYTGEDVSSPCFNCSQSFSWNSTRPCTCVIPFYLEQPYEVRKSR